MQQSRRLLRGGPKAHDYPAVEFNIEPLAGAAALRCAETDRPSAPVRGCRKAAFLLAGLLAAVGLLARLFEFSRDASLWYDECAVCVDIAGRDLGGLARPLSYDQAAPLGFLVVQKILFHVLGYTDAAARLAPLACGLLSIALIVLVSGRLFARPAHYGGMLLAIGLMCLNLRAIGYSAIAKQYSLECLVTLVLLLALVRCIGSGRNSYDSSARKLLVLSPFLLWFSYGAFFIIGAIALTLFARAASLKRREAWTLAAGFASSAMLNAVPFYLLSMRPATADRSLIAYWSAAFMPAWPPEAMLWWLGHRLVGVGAMLGLVHLRMAMLFPVALLAVGIEAVWSRAWFWIAGLASIALCLTASALHRYPFEGRLLLFLMPLFALVSAEAVAIVERHWRLFAAFLTGSMLFLATVSLAHVALRYQPLDEAREVQKEAMASMRAGDQLWVSSLATPCFLYYRRQYPLPRGVVIHLLQPHQRLTLPCGRNWLLVMRTPWAPSEGEALLREGAAAEGNAQLSFDARYTTARLYVTRGSPVGGRCRPAAGAGAAGQ